MNQVKIQSGLIDFNIDSDVTRQSGCLNKYFHNFWLLQSLQYTTFIGTLNEMH